MCRPRGLGEADANSDGQSDLRVLLRGSLKLGRESNRKQPVLYEVEWWGSVGIEPIVSAQHGSVWPCLGSASVESDENETPS